MLIVNPLQSSVAIANRMLVADALAGRKRSMLITIAPAPRDAERFRHLPITDAAQH